MRNQENQRMQFEERHPLLDKVFRNVKRVILGKDDSIAKCLVAMASGGHVLLEDVPGVGKTMLVKALARSINLTFRRIQFTPDLLPSDVTGISIYNQKTGQFEFRPGPIMGQVILADEINRTSPKTQSALLEAMEEASVTVDGTTYDLPSPFFVLATQNPIEYEGTYPLPEAQLDRFLMQLRLGYPSPSEEMDMLRRLSLRHPIEELEPVMDSSDMLRIQREVREVHVDDSLVQYMVEIAEATRQHASIYLGVSPRATLALYRAAQAAAYLHNRDYVVPDDIKWLAIEVLGHRIILQPESRLAGLSVRDVMEGILQKVRVPVLRRG